MNCMSVSASLLGGDVQMMNLVGAGPDAQAPKIQAGKVSYILSAHTVGGVGACVMCPPSSLSGGLWVDDPQPVVLGGARHA